MEGGIEDEGGKGIIVTLASSKGFIYFILINH